MTGQGDTQAALGWVLASDVDMDRRHVDGPLLATRDWPGWEANPVCAVVPAAEYDWLRAASEALARVEALAAAWKNAWNDLGLPAAVTPLVADLLLALSPTGVAATPRPVTCRGCPHLDHPSEQCRASIISGGISYGRCVCGRLTPPTGPDAGHESGGDRG